MSKIRPKGEPVLICDCSLQGTVLVRMNRPALCATIDVGRNHLKRIFEGRKPGDPMVRPILGTVSMKNITFSPDGKEFSGQCLICKRYANVVFREPAGFMTLQRKIETIEEYYQRQFLQLLESYFEDTNCFGEVYPDLLIIESISPHLKICPPSPYYPDAKTVILPSPTGMKSLLVNTQMRADFALSVNLLIEEGWEIKVIPNWTPEGSEREFARWHKMVYEVSYPRFFLEEKIEKFEAKLDQMVDLLTDPDRQTVLLKSIVRLEEEIAFATLAARQLPEHIIGKNGEVLTEISLRVYTD